MHNATHGRRRAAFPRAAAGLALLAGGLLAPLSATAQPDPLAPVATLSVPRDLAGKREGRAAQDVSGLACRTAAPGATALDCLVVSDEGSFAQRVTVHRDRIEAGPIVPLTGDDPPANAAGTKPDATRLACPRGEGSFAEFDGEAVAVEAGSGTFYVVGSHGCGRNSGRFRASSFLIARLRPTPSGGLAPADLSWRLSDVLRTAPTVGPFFGRSLDDDTNGLNIEGMAAFGGRLVFGLRAPSLAGRSFLVAVDAGALFTTAQAIAPVTYAVPLGTDAGIRDIATLPDGRLLVLSGPAQEQASVPFAVDVVTLHPDGTASTVRLARLRDRVDDGERAKAEAITPIGGDGGTVRALVLFDGPKNGAPSVYQLGLTP